MTISTDNNSVKFQLVSPIVRSLFGGCKTLKPRIVIANQIENAKILDSFCSYQEVITHLSVANNYFGARIEPNLFHLRVSTAVKNTQKEFIDYNEINIEACPINEGFNSKFLEFELDEQAFIDYLQCKPIFNPKFAKKEDSWFMAMVNNFFDDENNLGLEPIFTPTTNPSLQSLVDNAIKIVFDTDPQLEPSFQGSNSNNYSSSFVSSAFNIATVSQSNPNQHIQALNNSTKLNQLIGFKEESKPESIPSIIDVDFVEPQKPIPVFPYDFEEKQITHVPKKKNNFSLKGLILTTAVLGMLSYGVNSVFNSKPIQVVTQKPIITAPKVLMVDNNSPEVLAAKVKTYDTVIGSYISQDEAVCNKLQSIPIATKYGDNIWFAKDNSKYYLCQIGKVEKQSKQLTGEALTAFKQSNSAKVMNAITKSSQWLKMAN